MKNQHWTGVLPSVDSFIILSRGRGVSDLEQKLFKGHVPKQEVVITVPRNASPMKPGCFGAAEKDRIVDMGGSWSKHLNECFPSGS